MNSLFLPVVSFELHKLVAERAPTGKVDTAPYMDGPAFLAAENPELDI